MSFNKKINEQNRFIHDKVIKILEKIALKELQPEDAFIKISQLYSKFDLERFEMQRETFKKELKNPKKLQIN